MEPIKSYPIFNIAVSIGRSALSSEMSPLPPIWWQKPTNIRFTVYTTYTYTHDDGSMGHFNNLSGHAIPFFVSRWLWMSSTVYWEIINSDKCHSVSIRTSALSSMVHTANTHYRVLSLQRLIFHSPRTTIWIFATFLNKMEMYECCILNM